MHHGCSGSDCALDEAPLTLRIKLMLGRPQAQNEVGQVVQAPSYGILVIDHIILAGDKAISIHE